MSFGDSVLKCAKCNSQDIDIVGDVDEEGKFIYYPFACKSHRSTHSRHVFSIGVVDARLKTANDATI